MKKIVITGGPGAGKTAALEMARIRFGEQVSILPEAATILFRGGFPRESTVSAKEAAQRSIFHIQQELERMTAEVTKAELILCDRGTVDGLAYWPREPQEFWQEVGSTLEAEYLKYALVIHLRTPSLDHGYNHQNPFRVESAIEARIIDEKIALAWKGHPNVVTISSESDFVKKVTRVMDIIAKELA